ncbi:MAG: hypothetical protein IPL39_23875 [Opitutaceae bacterium]|nr:hypothetical protein [Opitutaceae bacterium]
MSELKYADHNRRNRYRRARISFPGEPFRAHRKTVDIEADEPIVLFHVLVSFLGGYARRLHHAARLVFREQPASLGTSTFFCQRPFHASIVSGHKMDHPEYLSPLQKFLRYLFLHVLSAAAVSAKQAKWVVTGTAAILGVIVANLAAVHEVVSLWALKLGLVSLTLSMLMGFSLC